MKICNKCKSKLNESQFNKNKSRKDGLQNYCRDCEKTKHRNWYLKNRESRIKKAHNDGKLRLKWFEEYKRNLKCEKCGENHIACLDFHHKDKDNKESSISKMVTNNCSIKKIKKEMEKCMVLCSNCHRILHYELR